MRDSLNHVQGNDLGAGWIEHHTDLLLLFDLLCGMVNLSNLPIAERRRSKPCLNLRMVYIFFSLYKAAFANRRLYGEDQPRPIFCRRNHNWMTTMRYR